MYSLQCLQKAQACWGLVQTPQHWATSALLLGGSILSPLSAFLCSQQHYSGMLQAFYLQESISQKLRRRCGREEILPGASLLSDSAREMVSDLICSFHVLLLAASLHFPAQHGPETTSCPSTLGARP